MDSVSFVLNWKSEDRQSEDDKTVARTSENMNVFIPSLRRSSLSAKLIMIIGKTHVIILEQIEMQL